MIKLAIDAMGGDKGPEAVVSGVNLFLNEFKQKEIEFHLFGDKNTLENHINEHPQIIIHHCSEYITQEDDPLRILKRKKDSSMIRAMNFVKEGHCDAIISSGNTGALMTSGMFILGRIPGIDRPALCPIIPNTEGKGVLLIDAGANITPKAEHLLSYGVMGEVYAKEIMRVTNPKVGLLNVGAEAKKGTDVIKEAYALLTSSQVNFIGNVEARDVPFGKSDVVVSDGFSGNILLKSIEGTAQAILYQLKNVLTSNLKSKIGASILKSSLTDMKKKLDYTEYGGAPLLGLNHICIKAHGSSNDTAFKNTIKQTINCIEEDMINKLKKSL